MIASEESLMEREVAWKVLIVKYRQVFSKASASAIHSSVDGWVQVGAGALCSQGTIKTLARSVLHHGIIDCVGEITFGERCSSGRRLTGRLEGCKSAVRHLKLGVRSFKSTSKAHASVSHNLVGGWVQVGAGAR